MLSMISVERSVKKTMVEIAAGSEMGEGKEPGGSQATFMTAGEQRTDTNT